MGFHISDVWLEESAGGDTLKPSAESVISLRFFFFRVEYLSIHTLVWFLHRVRRKLGTPDLPYNIFKGPSLS